MMRYFWPLLFLAVTSCSTVPPKDDKVESENKELTNGFDAELTTFAYPWPVNFYTREIQKQKLRMAYMDVKPDTKADKKQTIVLLHGKNFGGFYFERLARDLSARGYRVVIPDQIGFGKSSKPEHFQYSFAQLGSLTADLLKEIDVDEYILLGHSMGGMLATHLAVTYPKQIKKLIYVNPIGLEDYRLLTSYKTIDQLYENELKATEDSIKAYQNESYYGGEWKPAYDALIAPAVGWTKGPDKALIAWTSALTSDMIYNQPVTNEFKLIQSDTLIIIGQRDRTAIGKAWASPANQKKMGDYPRLGKSLAKSIARSNLVELSGLGHVPFIEDYNRFAKALFEVL